MLLTNTADSITFSIRPSVSIEAMHSGGFRESLKNRLEIRRWGRRTASPAQTTPQCKSMLEPNAAISLLAHISIDTRSPELRDTELETGASSSNTTEPHDLSDSHIADARAVGEDEDTAPKSPHQPVTASEVPPSVERPTGVELPTTESTGQPPRSLSISQRFWNRAYDDLKKDDDTAKLIGSYIKTLTEVLEAEHKIPSGTDTKAELEDPAKRQEFMTMLVEKGKAKVAKASKITTRVGDFVEAILLVKPIGDWAISNIPHAAPAALPWAGVCAALQVRLPLDCLACISADAPRSFRILRRQRDPTLPA